MDYGFAPGRIGQDRRVRNLLTRRPNTNLIARRRRRTTVRQFVQHVSTHGSITRPIDDLLIGTHANAQGILAIPMYPGQRGATNFETLESTIGNAHRSIAIPDSTIGHSSGNPITHSFHIKGCNIGRAPAFLAKLKEALGGNVLVTAPKYFHFLYDKRRFGTIEGLSYQFNITQSTALGTRAAVLAAFQAVGTFQFYDGTYVPNANWDNWLPARIRARDLRRRRRINQRLNLNLGQSIGTRTTVRNNIQFRTDVEHFRYTIKFPSANQVPNGSVNREQALENALNTTTTFDTTHDFPQYERWGYNSINEFIQGFTWRFVKNGKILICRGTRFSYTLMPPIVDTNSGNFLFNYYPVSSSGNAAITNGILVTDNRFFATV